VCGYLFQVELLRIVKVAIALLDHLHVAAQREVHCVDITQLLSGLGAAFCG